jgi:hypothetical protein
VRPLRAHRSDLPILVFTAQETDQFQMIGVDLVLIKSRASLDQLVGETMRRIDQLARQGR